MPYGKKMMNSVRRPYMVSAMPISFTPEKDA
jgi:hypothetical protein